MIDPHVLQGGASSWLRIAANEEGFGLSSGRLKPAPTDEGPPDVSGFTAPGASDLTPGPRLTPDT